METLHKSVLVEDGSGDPIPMPFKSWTNAGVAFTRGDLSMIAGPPGAGKSTVALNIAVGGQIPTLYFSADSSKATQSIRIVAMVTGQSMTAMRGHIDAMGRDFWTQEWVQDALKQASHIRWVWDGQPTLQTLDNELDVYATTQGTYPEMVVLDNAGDFLYESGDEFSSLRSLMKEFKLTCRDLGIAGLTLHHTSEAVQGNPCPPLFAVQGKINQTPATVVTLGAASAGFLPTCAVKNRNGRAARGGDDPVYLEYHPDLALLRDWQGLA
mgnify:CR=1 FL=1